MKTTTSFIIASMAIIGAMASPAPSQMGIEVIRRDDGLTMVREVPRSLSKWRACTHCVHVGGKCTIGEGNCYATKNALYTDCENGHVICVDQDGGFVGAP